MNKRLLAVKLFAFLLGLTALSACVTTQQTMPDGSTKVHITNKLRSTETQSILGEHAGGVGEVSLVPKVSPLGAGQFLFLNGQFDYECMSGLLYAAKSNVRLPDDLNRNCRNRYFARQSQLRRARAPGYDKHVPEAGSNSTQREAYWASLAAQVIGGLKEAGTFAIRFGTLPTINPKGGAISVRIGFVGEPLGALITLRSIPERVVVAIDDAAFANSMRANSVAGKTDIGEMVSCSAKLNFVRTADLGVRPAGVSAREFSRYQVQFKVVQIGCSDSTKHYKMEGAV